VLFGHNATALHRCDHGPPHVDQALRGGTRMARATPQPQQGALRGLQMSGQHIHLRCTGVQGCQRQWRHISRKV